MGAQRDKKANIPVIDISDANPNAAQQLLDAGSEYGFIFVANNKAGISPDSIDTIFKISKDFFALPTKVKQEVSINSNKAGKNHGWLSPGVEKLDPANQKRPDVKEAFNLAEPPDQPLPALFKINLQQITDFQTSCSDLCDRILTLLAIALDIPSDWFTSRHDGISSPKGSVFRMLYYPSTSPSPGSGVAAKSSTPTPDHDEEDIRAGAHSDYGSVTLLFRLPGQPGLEIQTASGEWASVPVDPNTHDTPTPAAASTTKAAPPLPILVNIGDLLEDWTDGLLKSTVHRVVFPPAGKAAEDRYSMAYFCHPNDDARLEPVPSRVVEEYAAAQDGLQNGSGGKTTRARRTNGEGGEVLTAKDHLASRLAATYHI